MPNTKLAQFYKGKCVVITGAASGIGEALAALFAELGCKIALCDIDEASLVAVKNKLEADFPSSSIYSSRLDVSDESAWDSFLASCADKLGHIDILINNAGIEGSAQPAWSTPTATLQRVMNVNFYGMVYGSQRALPYLSERPWAALVNVSSIFGLIAPPNTADYCASKFAIRGYTESLKAELALIQPHIQVHLVHPGGIDTNITRLEYSQEFKQRFLKTKPEALALKIASSVMSNKARVIYGYQSRRAGLASRLLPLHWLAKILGKQVKGLGLDEDYKKDHAGFARPSREQNK